MPAGVEVELEGEPEKAGERTGGNRESGRRKSIQLAIGRAGEWMIENMESGRADKISAWRLGTRVGLSALR
jgi:hypothetical protein